MSTTLEQLKEKLNKILRETEWTEETSDLLEKLQKLLNEYED